MLFPTVDVVLDGAKILRWKFKLWNKIAFLFFFWVLLRYYSFNAMNQSSNCKSNICGNTLCDILKQPTLFFPSFCCQLAAVQGFLMGQRADSRRCHCPVAKRHAARRLIKLLLKPVKTQVKASVSAREAFSAILSSFFVSSNLKEKKKELSTAAAASMIISLAAAVISTLHSLLCSSLHLKSSSDGH